MNQENFAAGLVSVTFRKLSPVEIVALVQRAKLDSIEWGGDVHVPPGEVARAKEVAGQTADAGLKVAAYGSYYRAGVSEGQGQVFEQVLETAKALGAPLIRVWAGNKASAELSASERSAIIDDLARITALAAAANVIVATEYHANTLTDSIDAARAMLDAVPNLQTLWQPPNNQPIDHCIASLKSVLPRTNNVHVFHWIGVNKERQSLADGASRWIEYIKILRAAGKPRTFLLEFVRGDSPDQFLADAATLRTWLAPARLL